MGCGISKFGPEDEAGSSRRDFCPLRQSNVHPLDQEFYSQAVRGRKSVASPAKGVGVVEEQAVKEITARRLWSEGWMEKERGLDKKEIRKEKVSAKAVQEEEGHLKEVVEMDPQNGEVEKEPCNERGDGVIGPASPSFREYCMDVDGAESESNLEKEGSLDFSEKGCKKARRRGGFRSMLNRGRRKGRQAGVLK